MGRNENETLERLSQMYAYVARECHLHSFYLSDRQVAGGWLATLASQCVRTET